MSNREIAWQRITDILGESGKASINKFAELSPDFANYILDFGYGDIYARPGLTDKSRELAAVACLIGQGVTGLPLRAHLQGMQNVGWTQNEIIELIIFTTPYVGFPKAVEAMCTLADLLKLS